MNKMKLPANLAKVFSDNGVGVEPFDASTATQLGRFPYLQRLDPIDRMILAQASMQIGTTFFTADEAITGLDYDWVFACD